MPKGVLNPAYERARLLAQEMGDDTDANAKRIMSELKRIREEGFKEEVAIACWRELKRRLNANGLSSPRLIAVLRDGRMDKFIHEFFSGMPAVYESWAYDAFVKENCELLKAVGWVYRGGRIPVEELDKMGIGYE